MLLLMKEQGIQANLPDAERALARKSVMFRGEFIDLGKQAKIALQAFEEEIMATVTRMVDPYSATLNGLILAGGGASFVEQPLRRVWHNIITAPGEDSRYMVAEGMARWGAGVLLARRAALSASPA